LATLVVRAWLGLQQRRDIPRLLQAELRMHGIGAARHVVLDEADGALETVHAGAVIVAVRPPERGGLVAQRCSRRHASFAEAVRLMAGGADADKDLGATLGAGRLLGGRRGLRLDRLRLADEAQVGEECRLLARAFGQLAAIHRPGHAFIDALGERDDAAAARGKLWIGPDDADQRQSRAGGAAVEMAGLAAAVG